MTIIFGISLDMAVRGKARKWLGQSRTSLALVFVTRLKAIELTKLIDTNFVFPGVRDWYIPACCNDSLLLSIFMRSIRTTRRPFFTREQNSKTAQIVFL